MPRISQSFIRNRLIPAVSIEGYIGRYLTLKPAGGAHVECCCPFHHEKTPSFKVNTVEGFYYCFGCKKGGNVLTFAMEYNNMSFTEAVKDVAEFAGIEVEYEEGSWQGGPKQDYQLYYDLMDRCAAFFISWLNKSPAAMDYFTKNRGLGSDLIVRARLGYAPGNWDAFMREVAKNKQEEDALVALGMLIRYGSGEVRPMFRNRVMIPILDIRGRVISFGGRTLGDDQPKYLNTKENPIFRKRTNLFGLYEALQASHNRPPRLVVVEGYMDVIALRQAGINYAVASLGTATTPEHFALMFRYTDQVICCYDGDQAGQRASMHALQTVAPMLKPGKILSFAVLPDPEDPDSLVRRDGPGAMLRIFDEARSISAFIIEYLCREYGPVDNDMAVSRVQAAALRVIKMLALKYEQANCIKALAQRCNVEEKYLFESLEQIELSAQDQRRLNGPAAEPGSAAPAVVLKTPMSRLIAFMLQQPTVTASVYELFLLDDYRRLLKAMIAPDVNPVADSKITAGVNTIDLVLDLIYSNPGINIGTIIESVRGSANEALFLRLINTQLLPKNSGDYSLEKRAVMLADYLSEALLDVIRQRSRTLQLINAGRPKDRRSNDEEIAQLKCLLPRRSRLWSR